MEPAEALGSPLSRGDTLSLPGEGSGAPRPTDLDLAHRQVVLLQAPLRGHNGTEKATQLQGLRPMGRAPEACPPSKVLASLTARAPPQARVGHPYPPEGRDSGALYLRLTATATAFPPKPQTSSPNSNG